MSLTVIISGCDSGPNPSAGLGIARSLRLAYPEAELVAMDYSVDSSGIHAGVFNSVWLSPSWDQLDLESHAQAVCRRLSSGGWMISALDLEAQWLSQLSRERILVPPPETFAATAKPRMHAACDLPVQIPDWMPLSAGSRAVEAFCRKHGWSVWIKGPKYESRRATNWKELQLGASELGSTWGTGDLYVQEDVCGTEVSIMLAAFRGQLLDAVFMEKRKVTVEGKTWSGSVSDLPYALADPLARAIGRLHWTGGSELEFVRDEKGRLWLIDWNPRFPGWVFGATLAGRNLPALLLSAASGVQPKSTDARTSQFIRVVYEIPVRPAYPLPPLPPVPEFEVRTSKHPSGMPLLMRRLSPTPRPVGGEVADFPTSAVLDELVGAALAVSNTPCRVVLAGNARARFYEIAEEAAHYRGETCELRVAYSVKTNPRTAFLELARECGFLAEVISEAEIKRARSIGFTNGDILFNGPVPCSCWNSHAEVGALFADSIEGFEEAVDLMPPGLVIGARLRPPFVHSRFGINLDCPDTFGRLIAAIRRMPRERTLGVSLHLQSSEIGVKRWADAIKGSLAFAQSIEELGGRAIRIFNLGGGWAAEDFKAVCTGVVPELTGCVHRALRAVATVIMEPGKALVEPYEALVTRVLEVRPRPNGSRDVIVDAGLNDVPLIHFYPHRIIALDGTQAIGLPRGEDRIFGRLCMENDILARDVALPPALRTGTRLAICDVGGYDASMSYQFGMGEQR